jgi:hypothetical protein
VPIATPRGSDRVITQRCVSTAHPSSAGSLASQNEAERQSLVWEHLRKELAADELAQVEFVLTNAPSDATDEE